MISWKHKADPILCLQTGPWILAVLCMMMGGCAGTTRAHIDRGAEGGIVWPGAPEQPRIKYLWAVKTVETIGGSQGTRNLESFVLGDVDSDVQDPRSSNTLMRPYGVFSDDKRLYIADPGAARVTVIDLEDSRAMQLIDLEEGRQLDFPTSVTADSKGMIYVADPNLGKVAVFEGKGAFQRYLDGPFKRPAGLAYDRTTDRVYVADAWAHEVYGYDGKRERVMTIGRRGSEDGSFNYPAHVFVDGAGKIYVSDSMNFRVQVFNPGGDFLYAVGSYGDAYSDLDKPKGVAVDSEGDIYVADAGRDTVKVFDREGNLLVFFGKHGLGLGEFSMPTGLFIDRNDVIYVADMLNMRVQAFQYLRGGDRT